MIKCSYAGKYKGIYPPRCNDGKGCDTCRYIYYMNKKYGKIKPTKTTRA